MRIPTIEMKPKPKNNSKMQSALANENLLSREEETSKSSNSAANIKPNNEKGISAASTKKDK